MSFEILIGKHFADFKAKVKRLTGRGTFRTSGSWFQTLMQQWVLLFGAVQSCQTQWYLLTYRTLRCAKFIAVV